MRSVRLFSAQSVKYRLISVWYGMPVRSDCPLSSQSCHCQYWSWFAVSAFCVRILSWVQICNIIFFSHSTTSPSIGVELSFCFGCFSCRNNADRSLGVTVTMAYNADFSVVVVPIIRKHSSYSEWSGSSNRIAASSRNTVFASSKEIWCFFWLIRFLFSSHSNLIVSIIIL